MEWAQWRAMFDPVHPTYARRGKQIWATRQRVYDALADYVPAGVEEPPTIAKLEELSDVARDTLYRHFGPSEKGKGADYRQVISNNLMKVAVLEAKEWTWEPYNEGLLAALANVALPTRHAMAARIRALAWWAQDYPHLAAWEEYRPPASASRALGATLIELGATDPDFGEVIAAQVVKRAVTGPGESALGVLNSVRPLIDAHIGDLGTGYSLASAVTRYLEAREEGTTPDLDDEAIAIIEDLLASVKGHPDGD